MPKVIQRLANYRDECGGVRATIQIDPLRMVYQAIVFDAAGLVTQIFEPSLSWTIWACREWLAGNDVKSSGRWVV